MAQKLSASVAPRKAKCLRSAGVGISDISYEYAGPNGQISSAQLPGGTVHIDYGVGGRLARIIDPSGVRLSIEQRNVNGDPAQSSEKSAQGERHEQRQVSSTSGSGRPTIEFLFNPAGQLEAAIAGDAGRISFTYDPVGRIRQILNADGSRNVFAYRDVKNGRLKSDEAMVVTVEACGGKVKRQTAPSGQCLEQSAGCLLWRMHSQVRPGRLRRPRGR